MTWIQKHVHFDQPAPGGRAARLSARSRAHAERIQPLEKAITGAIQKVPPHMHAVIEALQALRGSASISAVTGLVVAVPLFSKTDGRQRLVCRAFQVG
jgi:hypothetical protein